MDGVRFGTYHSYQDFHLILIRVVLPNPDLKTYETDIPGGNGTIDFTDALGGVHYKNRSIKFVFAYKDGCYHRYGKNSDIANALHGKKLKIILDDDDAYYYMGRVNFKEWKVDKSIGELSFEVIADPYKYELLSSLDDWLWDLFDFETGVIREYKDITVNGRADVTLIGSPMDVVPIITSSSSVTAVYNGTSYNLEVGSNKIYDILIGDEEQVITFIGTGIISVYYRGGTL